MRRHSFLAVTACVLFFIAAQASADPTISAAISPEWAPDTVLVNEPFDIDLYFTNDLEAAISGASMPLVFYSPDERITDVVHYPVRTDSAILVPDWRTPHPQDTIHDSSIVEKNGWESAATWVVFHQYTGFSWDGALPDTINGTFATVFGGWNVGPSTNYISFAYQTSQSGTFCVDSCSIPGVTPEGFFDWLWDTGGPTVSFNGPYCFTVYDTSFVPNQPPVLDPIGNKEVDEGQNIHFSVTASDPDGPAPALFTSTLPVGATFVDNGGGNGTFNWTPTFTQAGGYAVTFYATDGIDTVSEAIAITVNDVNRPPTLDPIGDKEVNETEPLVFLVSASDPDGTTPALFTSALPSGAAFVDSGNGNGSFSWSPTYDQAGTYPVTFYAADDKDTVSESITITVHDMNRPPTLAAIGDKETDEDLLLIFGISASDADGTIPELSTSSLPAGAVFVDSLNGNGSFSWTPTYEQAGTYPVTFYATDGIDTVFEEITITVHNVNRAPVLDPIAIGPLYVNEGDSLFLDVTASDPDGTIPALGAENLMANATFDDYHNGTGMFAFRPGLAQAGTYYVTFIATDGELADSEIVEIIVSEAQENPCLAVSPNPLTFLVNACDVELTIDTQFINISNCGGGVLEWTVTAQEWFDYDKTSGIGNDSVAVSFKPAVLEHLVDSLFPQSDDTIWATATAPIEAAGATNSPVLMVYELGIYCDAGDAQLAAVPTSFEYELSMGDSLLGDTLYIYEPGGRTIPFWTWSNYNTWLEVDTMDATPLRTPEYIWLNVRTEGLTPGTYYDTVRVESYHATNAPLLIPVTLHVTAPFVVNTIPAEFNFTLEQGATVSDSLFVYEIFDRSVPINFYTKTDWLTVYDPLPEPPYLTPTTLGLTASAETLPVGTYYDTIFIVPDFVEEPFDTVYVPVSLTVVEQIEYTVNAIPDYFDFTLNEGDSLMQFMLVYEEGGAEVAFDVAVMLGSSWLHIHPLDTPFTRYTPDSAYFDVYAYGLTPGIYADTILIFPPVHTMDTAGFEEVKVPVVLRVEEEPYVLMTDPTEFSWVVTSGEFGSDSLRVYEEFGRQIMFNVTEDILWLWLDSVPMPPYLTPTTLRLHYDSDRLPIGVYHDTIHVAMVDTFLVDTPNPPTCVVYVPVTLTIEGQAEFIVETAPTHFEWTLNQGEALFDSLFVYEIHGDSVGFLHYNYSSWLVVDPLAMPPYYYMTPYLLPIGVSAVGLDPGIYVDTILITPDVDSAVFPSVAVPAILTVEGPAVTRDSVWISTVPGVPGSDVVVPIYFRNFETLKSIYVPLVWNSGDVFLNDITFDGTRVEYVDSKPTAIDNDTWHAEFAIMPTFTPDIALGRGMLAKLHFTVLQEATEAFVSIDTSSFFAGQGLTFIDSVLNIIHPTFISGGVVIDTSAGFICGRVVDIYGNEIEGATVELWDDFPGGGLMLTDITDVNGQFACHTTGISPFDAYAYKEGYYPGLVEGIQFGEIGIEIVLTPVPPVTPTPEWVDFYCDDNYFYGVPLPVGSVVDAYDPDGVHCGTWFVTEPGSYGLMPVYRDDIYTIEDEGAEPGDMISFFINGYPANAVGDRIWTENGDNFEVCLDVFTVEDRIIPLAEGWNLISWNVDLPDDDIQEILTSISDCVDVVLGFEQGGFTYDPDLPDFSTLWTTDHFHGYWIRMNCPGTLVVTGVPVAATTPIELEAGWNLVSYMPNEPDTTPHALTSVHDFLVVALGFDGVAQTYDPSLPEYSTLPYMRPDFGYWLKVMHEGSLVYPGIGPKVVFKQPFAGAARPSVTDKVSMSRLWVDIYSYNLRLDGAAVPAGIEVEVVAGDGQIVGAGIVGADGKFGFVPVYGDDPSTADVEGLSRGGEFRLVIDGVETVESFSWSEAGDRLEIGPLTSRAGSNLLPDDFGLGQNYPNPFNPRTTVEFSVPYSIQTTVEVYNILGKKVKTIFDGVANAGINTVTWDGTSTQGEAVASGIYFYRMKAADFEKTRKMVLMK